MRTIESNSTDATRGQSLRARVEARQHELQAAVARLPADDSTRRDLEAALTQIKGLLTGDLDAIPNVVAVELNTWLEASKHLDEHHRDKYLPKLDAQLAAWRLELDKLVAQAAAAGAQAKADAQRTHAALVTKLDAARAKLEAAKAAGAGPWEVVKQDLDRVWRDAEVAFKNLVTPERRTSC
jgi:hypothetical protein